MARIKTIKYEFDGKEIEITFNCSASGVFSTNLHAVAQDKLGLQGRLESSSLNDLEKTVRNAFIAYKEANTSYELVIALVFKASGQFLKKVDGEYNEKFYSLNYDPHKIREYSSRLNSSLGIDYRILIKENRDGRIYFHNTEPKSFNPFHKKESEMILVGEYYSSGATRIEPEERIIAYSDNAFKNLQDITMQFQKASSFLVDLVTDENIELILSSDEGSKMLTQN